MSGLFRRARAYRTRIDLLGEEIGQDDFVLDIPEEERLSVLSGIDNMLKDDRIRRDEGALRLSPENRAFTLPLVLNLGAILILAVGAFVLFRVFNRGQSELASPEIQLVSAEGRILERLKRDAEAELGEKDRQIADIQTMLSNLESQKDLLAAQTEAQLADREDALRDEFQSALDAERARLADVGISGDNLNIAMSTFEAEARARFDESLAEAQSSLEAEREQRVAELEAQRSAYEQQIAAAAAERSRIEEELQSQTTELAAQAEARSAEASETARQLENLQARREQEKLVTDQVLAFYDRVGEARSVGDYDTALDVLDALENYLRTGGIQDSGVVAARRDVDVFLIGAIRRLVELESTPQAVSTVPDRESADTLAALAEGAVVGTRRYESGDVEGAQQAWREAFSAIPELAAAFETAFSTGGASPDELAAARSEGREAGLVQGRAEAQSGYEAEMSRRIEETRREALAEGRRIGVEESGDSIESLRSRLETLTGRIGDIADRYSAALVRTENDEAASRGRLVGLLEQKLSIKADLDPSLHQSLEDYTDATGDLRELEGRQAVYEEIVRFLEDLESEESAP